VKEEFNAKIFNVPRCKIDCDRKENREELYIIELYIKTYREKK